MYRFSRQKVNKKTLALNGMLDQMVKQKYTEDFIQNQYTVSRIVHMLSQNTSLNEFKKI